MSSAVSRFGRPRRADGLAVRARLGRHGVFLAVLLAGVALRIAAQLSYRPVLLFNDSARYLRLSESLDPGSWAPLGYAVLIKAVLHVVPALSALAVCNHLLGIAVGVVLYATLSRRGVPAWLAALASAGVLLDAYQLFLEQMVMSEALFETFTVLALVALSRRTSPRRRDAALAGLCFAGAGLTRYAGVPLILTGLLFVSLAGGRFAQRAALVAVLAGTWALAVGAYGLYNHARTGSFAISSRSGPRRLYARVAPFADCHGLALPSYERPLCPRPGLVAPRDGSLIEGYTFDLSSPAWHVTVPPGQTAGEVLSDFSKRVILHQPWAFARAVGGDFLRPFVHWTRSRGPGELPVERWRFTGFYPRYGRPERVVRRWGGGPIAVDRRVALALRRYQLTIGYAPGLVLAAAALLGLAGALGLSRRARRSELRAVCLLWTSTGLLVFGAAVVYEFSWRYFVPVICVLPAAGACGATALFGGGGEAANGPADAARATAG